jgi:ribosome-associated translation inhibitor RaiA
MQKQVEMITENNQKVVKKKVESYDISKSDETLNLAVDLAKFIKENKLFHNIQGKEFVNVEGWQYAGSRLGILPIVEELTNISDEHEMKYQAKVKLLNLRTEQVVGSGFAICSNKESGKKYYQEFAIASMAQTRAIGKAYRNILAWIIRAAGYEPTPAEEMDYLATPAVAETSKAGNTRPQSAPAAETVAAEVLQPKVVAQDEPVSKPATTKQKAEILLLLNNEVITAEEKEKMVSSINKLDFERAEKAIAKLKRVIAERRSQDMDDVAA